MEDRGMRVGDYVRDPVQNNTIKVTLMEFAYPELFEGIGLSRGFFERNGFVTDTTSGKEVLYRQGEDNTFCTAEDRGNGQWYVQIRHGDTRFSGTIYTVHIFQHLLSDCFVFWKIVL